MMRGRGFAKTWKMRMKKAICLKWPGKIGNKPTGANCVKDSGGKIVMEEERLMEVWRAHYDMLSNEEFTWVERV